MTESVHRTPKLSTLVFMTGISLLSLNMFLPSLSGMARDFGVDYGTVSLSIAGYLGVTAILQLVIGPLSDRFGRRPVVLISLAIFVVASLVCALASNMGVFLAFRALQGAVISGTALSRAIVRDMSDARDAAGMLAHISTAMAVAPMLGPMLGGGLDQLFGWRANFYTFAILGAALLALCWFDLGETNRTRADTFSRQFRLYPQLFRSRIFWGYTLCGMFSTAAFYAFLAGVPLLASSIFALSPAETGLGIGSITCGFLFGSFLSGIFAKRHSLVTMTIAGRIVACGGLAIRILLFALDFNHPAFLFGATVFVGIGNGLTMPSVNAGALSVRPDLAGSASGLSGALTVFGGAVSTAATGGLVSMAGIYALFAAMLFCSSAGLIAAITLRAMAPGE